MGDDIVGPTKNIYEFVPWNSSDASAVVAQLAAHIKFAKEQGHCVGLVAVLITENPAEPGKVYTPVYSTLMPEISMWAAQALQRQILKGQGAT